MYSNGNVLSGPQDSLADLLLPNKPEDLDKVGISRSFAMEIRRQVSDGPAERRSLKAESFDIFGFG